MFDVRDYGALGDGNTDDATALQAALTAVNSAGGGRLRLDRAKTYVVGSGLTVYANTVLDFNGSTVKVKSGRSAFNVFQSGNASNVQYVGPGTIDLNKANTTGGSVTVGIGIYWAPTSGNTYGHRAERVRVINGRSIGIRFTSQTSATDASALLRAEVTLRDVEVTGCTSEGVFLQGITDSVVDRVKSWSNGSAGISVFFALRSVITNCHAISNGSHGIVKQFVHGGGVYACEAHYNTGGGIVWGGDSTPGRVPNLNYAAVGNNCSNNGYIGIDSDSTQYVSTVVEANLTFVGNRCWNNGIHGIYLQNADGAVVTGNICWDNDQSGIAGQGRRFTLDGNHCYDNANYGIDIQGGYTAWTAGLATSSDATSGTVRKPTTPNGFIYRCTVAGTTGGVEPVWPTTTGATVTDNTVTWVATPIPGYHVLGDNNLHGNGTADLSVAADVVDVAGARGSKTQNWASLASGSSQSTTVTCNGAALNQAATASMSLDLAGTVLDAYVSAANTVTVVQTNNTGGAVDLASGTLYVRTRRIA